jgi:CzcA family heavy metal efflux pump
MFYSLIRLSIYKPFIIIAFMGLLTTFCGWKLFQTSLDIFPEFSPKLVIIQTEAPGLSTEQVENMVTRPLESYLAGIPNIDYMRSESIAGLSVITLTFAEKSSHNINRQLVLERLNGVKNILPINTNIPMIMPLASSAATIMTIGFTSADKNLLNLRTFVDQHISPALLSVKGVADVNIFGGKQKQLSIILDKDKLIKYSISIEKIIENIEAANVIISGSLHTANQNLQVISNNLFPLEKIRSINILNDKGQYFKLQDISTIKFTAAKQISKASIEATDGIIVMVIGQLNADTVAVTEAIDKALNKLNILISDNEIIIHDQIFRPANYILKSLHNIIDHLAIGGLLVLIVLILFMSNIKAALISALAIPISLILAAILTLSTGTSLNIMVIGGLAIALGEVVDDAIIDVENILRRLRENRKLKHPLNNLKVIYKASLEVRGSVIYASLIVMLVFVPLLLLSGVVGRMFAPLGIAYILAIFSSLISALTLTPALSSISFNKYLEKKDPIILRFIIPIYKKILSYITLFPRFFSIFTLLICLSGIFLLPKLMLGFLPELREGHFMIHTSSLTGTSLAETMRVGDNITNNVLAIEGVKTMSQWAGRAERGADTFGSHYSEFEVELYDLTGKKQQNVFDKIREVLINTPGISFEANSFLIERVDETSSGFTSPIVIQVFGNSLIEIDSASSKLYQNLLNNKFFRDVQLKSVLAKPQINIELNNKLLALNNISLNEAKLFINTAIDGITIDSYYEDILSIPIVLSYRDDIVIEHIDYVKNLVLFNQFGQYVRLKDISKIYLTEGRYNILHDSGRKVQIITAKPSGGATDLALKEISNIIKKVNLGDNIYTNITGSAIEGKKARTELIIISFLVLIGILFLVLIAIKNIKNTFLVLINLPFALIGGIIAALLSGGLLSIGSIVGFVTLFGITLRNSIMLVSHYQHLVFNNGLKWNKETAIRGASERLPSILMTGLVTGLAMLPIAFDADNAGREIMGPMASIIIGGLTTSTILNLLILPAFLLAFGSFNKKIY